MNSREKGKRGERQWREEDDDDSPFESLDIGDPHTRRNGNSPH